MNLRTFFRALRLRKLSVALITLAAVAVSLLITLMQTPLYASTANLFVAAGNASENPDKPSEFAELRIQSYVEVFDGDTIARRVIQRLNLDESPADLSDQIHASADPKSVVMSVRVLDPSADRAKLLADAVANEFIAFLNDLETASSDAGPIKATLVDAPDKPTKPATPNLPLNLGLGLGIGLLLGLVWALVRERADTTVRTPSMLEDATDAPMLGSILLDQDAFEQPTIRDLDHYDPRVEGYRILRTALQFAQPDPLVSDEGAVPSWPTSETPTESRVYVVTSSLPDEGKTTTAINLALILAEGGERVVLVEADLRRPTVSEYLALNPAIGLTTTLIGRTTLDEALQEVGALDVLTSGRRPPNPAEMVKSQPMHALIESLREQYTYVLIDAPPLIPVTDACLLAAVSDGVILVTRYGDTKEIELASAVNRLRSVNGRIVGTILNMTPANDAEGHGYGYGYAPHAIGNGPGRDKDAQRPKVRGKAGGKAGNKAPSKPLEEPVVEAGLPPEAVAIPVDPTPVEVEEPTPVEVSAPPSVDAPVEPPIEPLPAWLQDLPFEVPYEAPPQPSGKESRWARKAKPPKPPKAAKPPKPPKTPKPPKAPKGPKRTDVVVEEVPYASLLSRLGPAATPAEPEPETNELEMSGQSLLEQIESAMALAEPPAHEVGEDVAEPAREPEVVEDEFVEPEPEAEPEPVTSPAEPSGSERSERSDEPEIIEDDPEGIEDESDEPEPEPEVVEPEPEVVDEVELVQDEVVEPELAPEPEIIEDEVEVVQPEPEPEPEPVPEPLRERPRDIEPSRPMVWPASWGVQTAGSFVDSESADDPVETTHRFPGVRPAPSNVQPQPKEDEDDLVSEVDPVPEPPRAED